MVYLTGDTHGDIDRFKHGKLRWLGKRDTEIGRASCRERV